MHEPRNFRQRLMTSTEKPILEEISPRHDDLVLAASSGGNVGDKYAKQLKNTDDLLLAQKGGGLEVYEKIMTDDQVFSNFQQRRLALLSKPLEVQPGGTDKADVMAADFIREMMETLQFDSVSNKMLYGVMYGYAAAECMYGYDGKHVFIDDIRVRKAQRFRYDEAGRLRLKHKSNANGILMPEKKFWTFESGSDNDDNPYGIGLLAQCFWPVFFKRNGTKYWMLALEKYGAPTAVGKYPANATQDEKDKLLDAVAAFASVAGLAIPETMAIELLSAGSKVGGNHDTLIKQMNASISKVILSQTMTTDDGSSNSQANVHLDVREDITAADADLQCGSLTRGPLRWLMDWNYPNAKMPKVRRVTEPPSDLDKQVTRDKTLYEMGFAPTDEHILETYGEGYVRIAKAEDSQDAGAAKKSSTEKVEFAQSPEYSLVEDYLNSPDHTETLALNMAAFIDEIEDILEGAGDLQSAKDALFDILPVETNDGLATNLAQAAFSAHLKGVQTTLETTDEDSD